MSCLATFYVLPEGQRAAFLSARDREPRVAEKKVLFLKLKQPVPGEYVWAFLDRVATKKTTLEFSGFLLVDYLFVYLQVNDEEYFERLDEYYLELRPNGAEKLASFLSTRPVGRVAIESYLKEDGRPLAATEREDTLAAYEQAHSGLLEWCASVRSDAFGVLHLSF